MALADRDAAERSGIFMLSWGNSSAIRDFDTARPSRIREIYQRYAAGLYRQALLNPGDAAPPGDADCDAVVNERALAAIAGSHPRDAAVRHAGTS